MLPFLWNISRVGGVRGEKLRSSVIFHRGEINQLHVLFLAIARNSGSFPSPHESPVFIVAFLSLEFLIYCASFIVESYKSCILGEGAGGA